MLDVGKLTSNAKCDNSCQPSLRNRVITSLIRDLNERRPGKDGEFAAVFRLWGKDAHTQAL
jgi:hypothetical protein